MTNSSQQIGGGNPYGFTYSYDVSGALASETYPSKRTVTITFDAAGRINGVSGALSGSTTNYASGGSCPYGGTGICYAPQGAIQGLTLKNSLNNVVLSENWSFNPRQQPVGLTVTNSGGTQLMNLGWSYGGSSNDDGDILTHTIQRSTGLASALTVLTQYFSYMDPANRLIGANEGSAWSQTYGYDAFGNRAVTAGTWVMSGQSYTMPNAGFTPQHVSEFNNQNQWKRGAGDAYDGAGNQVSTAQVGNLGTAGSTFTYDGENRLLTGNVAGAGGPIFVYDGEGRRVEKIMGSGSSAVTTTYIHDAEGELAAEFSTSADPASGTQYLSADHLGSTRLITDALGNPQRCIDYLPFGEEIPAGVNGRTGPCYETLGSAGNPQYPSGADVVNQKFTGKERDAETGLDYFGARYMSSAQGRFTTPDPLMASARVSDPQTWNRYTYTRNNPLRLVDPDGLAEISAEACKKDPQCVNVKINVIYDSNLTDKQKAAFRDSLLKEAKDEYGDSDVRLDVTETTKSIDPSNLKDLGLAKGAVNVLVGDSGLTTDPGVSGQTRNGYAVSEINMDAADKGTLSHELAHQFMGDTVGVMNGLSSLDPTGIVGMFTNTFADMRNDWERTRVGLVGPYFGNRFEAPPGQPMPLNAPLNEGAKRFQAPITQEAIRPKQ
ncbi:MAG: RHS repeat domain-containing protein [Bryobacteraceae bacterium]